LLGIMQTPPPPPPQVLMERPWLMTHVGGKLCGFKQSNIKYVLFRLGLNWTTTCWFQIFWLMFCKGKSNKCKTWSLILLDIQKLWHNIVKMLLTSPNQT
jgi:hypothetical protein